MKVEFNKELIAALFPAGSKELAELSELNRAVNDAYTVFQSAAVQNALAEKKRNEFILAVLSRHVNH